MFRPGYEPTEDDLLLHQARAHDEARQPGMPTTSPTFDWGQHALVTTNLVDDATKADLHDLFHSSGSTTELAHRLNSFPKELPLELKQELLAAKSSEARHAAAEHASLSAARAQKKVLSPLEAAIAGTNELGQFAKENPEALAVAKKFPKLATQFIDSTKN